MPITRHLDQENRSWEHAKHLRLIAAISILIMVITATDAHGAVDSVAVTPWGDISVTLPIYISSVITAFGCGVTFTRWTSRREREHNELVRQVARLEKLLTEKNDESRQAR